MTSPRNEPSDVRLRRRPDARHGGPHVGRVVGVTAGLYAVVVTGARDWADEELVHRVLQDELGAACEAAEPYIRKFVLIHGDCPTGADSHADNWSRQILAGAVECIPMPAQWDEHGKAGGPIRNNQMAVVARCLSDCGWTVTCHAFGLAQSKGGTKDCVKALEARDFDVTIHEASE